MLRCTHSGYMRVPRRGFSLAAPPPPPPSSVLDALAHATPGTSTFSKPLFEAGSDTPYPIWFLDPHGLPYRTVLSFAQRSGDVLTGIHEATSLPWWATVVGVGVCIRVALLPFTLYSMRNASRAGDAALDIVALRRGYARARAALDSAAAAATGGGLTSTPTNPTSLLGPRLSLAATLARGVRAALHKVHCYPARSLAMPLLQIPPVLAGVMGARHVVLLGDTSFETGGALWFKDLTLPDPTFALPAIALSLAYVSLEVMFARPAAPAAAAAAAAAEASSSIPPPPAPPTSPPALLLGAGGIAGLVKEGLQLSIILSLPFTYELPAGLYLLMAANSSWTIGFLTMVRTPAVYQAITGRYPEGRGAAAAVAAAAAKDGGSGSDGGGGGGGASRVGFRVPSPYAVFTPTATALASSPPAAFTSGVGGGGVSALNGGVATTSPSFSFPSPPPLSSNSSELLMVYSTPEGGLTTTTPTTPITTAAAALASVASTLQHTPRMLYYDEDVLDRGEEVESMATIQQCMNTGLPVVGGANPLVLRFAGAAASNTAPWVHLEAMPSMDEEGQKGQGQHVKKRQAAPPPLTAEDLLGEEEVGGGEEEVRKRVGHGWNGSSSAQASHKLNHHYQQQQQQQQEELQGEGRRVLAAFRDLWPSAMLHPGYAVSSGGTGGVLNGPFPSALLPPSFMGASAALALPPSQVWWEQHQPPQQQQLEQQSGGGMLVTTISGAGDGDGAGAGAGGVVTTLHSRWLEVHRQEQEERERKGGGGGGYGMFSSEVSFLGGLSGKQQQQQQQQQPVISVGGGGERRKKPTLTPTINLTLPFFSLASYTRQQGGSTGVGGGGMGGGGGSQRKRRLSASTLTTATATPAAADGDGDGDAESSADALAEMQQRQLNFDITKELVSILHTPPPPAAITPSPSTSATPQALLLPPLPVRVSEGIGREHTFLVGMSSGGGGGGGKQVDASFERSKNSGQRGQAVFLPTFLLRQEIHELGFPDRAAGGKGREEGERKEGEGGGGGRKKKGGGKRGWKRE